MEKSATFFYMESFTLLFLLFSAFFHTLQKSLKLLGKHQAKQLFKNRAFTWIFHPVFREDLQGTYLQILHFLRPIFAIIYAIFATLFLQNFTGYVESYTEWHLLVWILSILVTLSAFIFTDLFCHIVAYCFPAPSAKACLMITLPIFFLLSPILAAFLRLSQRYVAISKSRYSPEEPEALLREIEGSYALGFDAADQKWLSTFLLFKGRVAKEIMIPRIAITAIPESASLEKAAALFLEEGYSRIPVYKNSLDEITGVLLYKDLFNLYIRQKSLEESVKSLVKPVIYAPESKKIAALLQEFRAKQLHFAIIVDEYGGTEGIVTIEDILEELVGEIEDEYDVVEKDLFWKLPNGSWVVDAKLNITDVATKTGVHIPQSSEYETIGGYVFYRAGTIPQKGWSMHHDAFELEVLRSSEKAVEKIRLTPTKYPEDTKSCD